jgi:hypothetical protein
MARIFSIRISMSDKFHDALVNVVAYAGFLEYHLKAADEMINDMIKDCNILRLEKNKFMLKKKPSNEEAASIMESARTAISEHENNRPPLINLN